ncbi:FAD binding domain-containing protein [Paenibacillus sp. GCM10023252]|uniref:FAD binding domain-containing protein n=1 Tax=Paenibacillus sp. GCM10023252 TaxID=3252649 RepID=UPI00361FBE3E
MAMESREAMAFPSPGSAVQVWQPQEVKEAWRLKRRFGSAACYVAGSTWLRTRWEAHQEAMPLHLISLASISSLRGIHWTESGGLVIGAGVTLMDLRMSLYAKTHYPLIVEALGRIAAPSIRYLATIGGNVMQRSGDLLPALLVLDAEVRVLHQGSTLEMLLAEWLTWPDCSADSLLLDIRVPPATGKLAFYYKLGRRLQFTPSVIAVAGSCVISASGELLDLRLAAVGSGMPALRLYESEAAALCSREESISGAIHEAVVLELPAVSDDYASAGYKKLAAANLLTAHTRAMLGEGGGADANLT